MGSVGSFNTLPDLWPRDKNDWSLFGNVSSTVIANDPWGHSVHEQEGNWQRSQVPTWPMTVFVRSNMRTHIPRVTVMFRQRPDVLLKLFFRTWSWKPLMKNAPAPLHLPVAVPCPQAASHFIYISPRLVLRSPS